MCIYLVGICWGGVGIREENCGCSNAGRESNAMGWVGGRIDTSISVYGKLHTSGVEERSCKFLGDGGKEKVGAWG